MSIGKQVAIVVFALCIGTTVGVLIMGWALFYDYVPQGPEIGQMPKSITFAATASLFAMPTAILFGLPSFFVLRRFGLLKWWSVCILGAAVGALIGATGITSIIPLYMDISLGLVSAFVTWLVLSALMLRSSGTAQKHPAP